MTETTSEARGLLDAVSRSHAGAYALAKVVSLAARVEPALVRKARVELLPRCGAGDEADLWFGPLAQARSPLAIVFAPEVAELLRIELSKDQKLLRDAWGVTKLVHEKSSPVIQLEEEVTYFALSEEPDAPERIRALLLRAAVSMVEGDGRGIAQWALRALPRLPARARDSEVAWALAVGAGARLGGRRILEGEAPGAMPRSILRWVLPGEHRQTEVGARLLEEGVEFSEPPAEGAHRISLPKTDPLLLEVSWAEEGEEGSKQVTLRPGQTQVVKTGPVSEIYVGTPSGESFYIRREHQFDVFVDASTLAEQLVPRLYREEWQGRPLRVAVRESVSSHPFTSDYSQQLSGEAGNAAKYRSQTERRASRKVVEEVDAETLRNLLRRASYSTSARRVKGSPKSPSRPLGRRAASSPIVQEDDPRLIRVYRGRELPPELLEYVHVDFSDDARFEESYRKLLALIKDEPYVEPPKWSEPVEVFYAYSPKDEEFLKLLETYLAPLKTEGLISTWSDMSVRPGDDWRKEIEERTSSSDIFLMLVSPDFFDSKTASEEMERALMRQRGAAHARIIPVIIRPCDWFQTPLGGFQALPADGRPLTSRDDMHDALQRVAEGIRATAEEIASEKEARKARDASGRTRVYISHRAVDSYSTELFDILMAELQSTNFDTSPDRAGRTPDAWPLELNEQMAHADAAVFLLSKSALRSDWVRREASVFHRRRQSDENFFMLTVLSKGVTASEVRSQLRLDLRETDFITTEGSLAETAQQIVEALTRFRDGKSHEPSYAERLEKLVAARLQDVPREVLTRAIQRSSGKLSVWAPPEDGSPSDILARHIIRGGLYQLGRRLSSISTYMSEPDARSIVELVAPTWVNPEAAAAVRRVAKGPQGTRALCVNCHQSFTARMYIDRANEDWMPWNAVGVRGGLLAENLFESTLAEIEERLRHSLRLDDRFDLRTRLELREESGESLFVIFHPPLPSHDFVKHIKSAFPTLTLFLMAGERMPRPDMFSPGYAEMIHPPLEPGEEERALEEYERLRDELQHGSAK